MPTTNLPSEHYASRWEADKESKLAIMHTTSDLNRTPLSVLIRRRRQQLSLAQAEVAQTLNVVPETVGQWERGHRRMELDKLPGIARALKLDVHAFCLFALSELHPVLYRSLFGAEPPTIPATVQ